MTDKERIAELEAEVAWLREELGRGPDEAETLSLRLGLTPQQARVLEVLYGSRGRCLSSEFITDALPRIWDTPRKPILSKLIYVYICQIRKRIGPHFIETIQSRGWRLTDAGLRLVAETLAP